MQTVMGLVGRRDSLGFDVATKFRFDDSWLIL